MNLAAEQPTREPAKNVRQRPECGLETQLHAFPYYARSSLPLHTRSSSATNIPTDMTRDLHRTKPIDASCLIRVLTLVSHVVNQGPRARDFHSLIRSSYFQG